MSHLRSSFSRRQSHAAVVGAPVGTQPQGSSLMDELSQRAPQEAVLNAVMGRRAGGTDAAFYTIASKPNHYPPNSFVIPAGGRLPRPEKIAGALRTALYGIGQSSDIGSMINYTPTYVSISPRVMQIIATAQQQPEVWTTLCSLFQNTLQVKSGAAR